MFCPRLTLAFLLLSTVTLAQPEVGLTAYYPFEGNLGDGTGDATNLGVAEGVADFGCGVRSTALLLSQAGDFVRIPGGGSNNVNREFAREDFTVSFYFKVTGGGGNQYLISKRDTVCDNGQYFFIRYAPGTRTLQATLRQGATRASITYPITNQSCWQHVVLLREDRRIRLFVNAEEVGTLVTDRRVDIENDGDLLIGNTTCRAGADRSFTGLIDELRIYGRALERQEVATLYLRPDRILTGPTTLFLGESVDVDLNSSCGTTFRWLPEEGVSDPAVAEPTITPVEAGRLVYRVQIGDDQSNCRAVDSLVLTVIDPDELDCSQVFLPKAFTPNGIGPPENETFGIANPFAIPELLSFEIYDRNGAQVFRTTDPFTRWDGSFRGQPLNAGVLLWRIVYRCEDREEVRTGSVTMLR